MGAPGAARMEAYAKKQREMMEFGGARLVIDIIGCKPPAPLMLVEAAIDFGIEMLEKVRTFCRYSERPEEVCALVRGLEMPESILCCLESERR